MRDTKARDSKAHGWSVRNSSDVAVRALRVAAVALAVGFVMMTGAARAQEDEDDDQTIEEKIIGGLLSGIGATNINNRGIDYRERSPLVVPPKLDLPPPQTAATEVTAPNWPKDPDEARRKAYIAKRKKDKKDTRDATTVSNESFRTLLPSELDVGKTAAQSVPTGQVLQPAENEPGTAAVLSPSQLGYTGGLAGLFGGSKAEVAPFKGEPTRDSLTQPPVGYQTPSPNFAYGTGPKESLNKEYNPVAGKYGE
jgi:hypothetical protein